MDEQRVRSLIGGRPVRDILSCEVCEHDVGCYYVLITLAHGEPVRIACASLEESEALCRGVRSVLAAGRR